MHKLTDSKQKLDQVLSKGIVSKVSTFVKVCKVFWICAVVANATCIRKNFVSRGQGRQTWSSSSTCVLPATHFFFEQGNSTRSSISNYIFLSIRISFTIVACCSYSYLNNYLNCSGFSVHRSSWFLFPNSFATHLAILILIVIPYCSCLLLSCIHRCFVWKTTPWHHCIRI